VTPRSKHIVVSLVVALGHTTLLLGQPVTPESMRDVVVASNGLIEQANALRVQALAGQITVAEARAEVAQLLPTFDEIDRRALHICQQTMDDEALAEAADLLVHGPVLQCLYVLTVADNRFPGGLGHAVVYERVLRLAEDDFRTDNSLNDPEVLRAHFSDWVPPAMPNPWVDAEALQALGDVARAREVLAGEQSVQERLASLAEYASSAEELLTQYAQTENPGLLAGYLQTRLEFVQAYAILLDRVTGDRSWSGVGVNFGYLAARAVNQPEDMLAVFSDPGGPPEEPAEEERPWDPLVKWFQIFRDVFNQPKPHVWRTERPERNVEIGIDEGRLRIRGRSDGQRSGRVTWRWSGRSFVFTIDMGGEGTGYKWHLGVEGDNGSWVDLAFGGAWADSVFEIRPDAGQAVFQERPADDLPTRRRHRGRIKYDENRKYVWAYVDDEPIGQGPVDLGRKKGFGIYVSSEDEVEYDAWFDNFDVRAP